jgi:hypothetical protein
MDIILSKERVDGQECDVLVTGFFKDERPLKGSSGWIDWRLNGKLSRLLRENKLTGDWKEATLIPTQGRVTPRLTLLLGLGEVKEYNYLRLRELSLLLLEILKKLEAINICLSLPYEEGYHVGCSKLAEVLIRGIADCINLSGYPFNGEWIKKLRLHFAEGEEHLSEVLSGVQAAKSILTRRIPIRILTPSQTAGSKKS